MGCIVKCRFRSDDELISGYDDLVAASEGGAELGFLWQKTFGKQTNFGFVGASFKFTALFSTFGFAGFTLLSALAPRHRSNTGFNGLKAET